MEVRFQPCPPAPTPSVLLGLAVEMHTWSPVIPKAKAEKQALQGCDFHHPMWSGEAEMASSRCAFVSAPAVKWAQVVHSWSDKPWAGSNVLLPPQGSFQALALLVKYILQLLLGVNIMYFPHMWLLGQYCLGKDSDVNNTITSPRILPLPWVQGTASALRVHRIVLVYNSQDKVFPLKKRSSAFSHANWQWGGRTYWP